MSDTLKLYDFYIDGILKGYEHLWYIKVFSASDNRNRKTALEALLVPLLFNFGHLVASSQQLLNKCINHRDVGIFSE